MSSDDLVACVSGGALARLALRVVDVWVIASDNHTLLCLAMQQTSQSKCRFVCMSHMRQQFLYPLVPGFFPFACLQIAKLVSLHSTNSWATTRKTQAGKSTKGD